MVNQTVRSMLRVYSCLKEQIRQLDRQLMSYARESTVCRQLMAIPGVWRSHSPCFCDGRFDDPTKFCEVQKHWARIFWLDTHDAISPARSTTTEASQNAETASFALILFEAAGTLLTRVEKWSVAQSLGAPACQAQWTKEGKDRCRPQVSCNYGTACGSMVHPSDGSATEPTAARLSMEVSPKNSVVRR